MVSSLNSIWDEVEQNFHDVGLNASFSNNERLINDLTISTWDVEFEHGLQMTTLSYSREEGILICANTSFSNYHLTFTLSGFVDGQFSSSEIAPLFNYLLVITVVFSFTIFVKRKK